MNLRNAFKEVACFLDIENRGEKELARQGWKEEVDWKKYEAAVTNITLVGYPVMAPTPKMIATTYTNPQGAKVDGDTYRAALNKARRNAYGLQ